MADINLLENQLNTDQGYASKRYRDLARKTLFMLIVLSLAAGGAFLFLGRVAKKAYLSSTQAIEGRQVELEESASLKRNKVVAKQAQLQYTAQLLAGHAYWTNILSLVNSVSVTDVQFTDLSLSAEGFLTFNALAPDFATMAAFTKSLQEKEGITSVSVGSSSLTSVNDRAYYRFSISVNFDPEVLKYKPTQ